MKEDLFIPNQRQMGQLALGALGILLVYALVFWRERVLFADASWIAFRIANWGSFQIQEHRYGSFITQCVPWLAVKAGLPLKAVLAAYALSFNAFYLVAGLVLYRWRQYALLVLLALYFTLTTGVGFYWTNNEVHQGMAWLLLFFGWIFRQHPNRLLYWLVGAVLCFLALSSHMLLLLVAGVLWVHFIIARKVPFTSRTTGTGLALMAIAISAWRYYMSKVAGWYDQEKLAFIDGLKFSSIAEAFQSGSTVGFWQYSWLHYPLVWVLLLVSLGILLRQKRWLAFAWHLLSLALFWFFLGITFNNFTAWYSESDWASWSMLVCVPLLLYPVAGRLKNASFIATAAVLLLSLFRIYSASTPFEKRLQQVSHLTGMLQKSGHTKNVVVLPDTKLLEEKVILAWPLPTEVLAFSSMAGNRPAYQLAIVPDAQQIPAATDTILIPFGKLPAKQFYPALYPIDTLQTYRQLPADSLYSWLRNP